MKKSKKNPAKRSDKWAVVTIAASLRKELAGMAIQQNRTVPATITELSKFWRRLHCAECQSEVLSGTCPCKQPGV